MDERHSGRGCRDAQEHQATDKEPYKPNDIIKILAACDAIGQRPYERLRARAMTLLLRYTALRIGDVATLARDRVRDGEIYLRTMKNGKVVKLPVHAELQAALDASRADRTTGESKYFFWSGNGTTRSMIRDATRTMASGLQDVWCRRCPRAPVPPYPRNRDPVSRRLARRRGRCSRELANIIEEALRQMVQSAPSANSTLFGSIFGRKGTPQVHEERAAAKDRNKRVILVDGMGLEPTTPTLRTWCSPS